MKYLSLFSGIGGFELALKDHECVGYSEVEKNAIKIYEKHFSTHKNFGDITEIDCATLPDFEILVGGFPCQSFSIAGKRGGFLDTRGTMFFHVAKIIKAKQPKHVLLENVKGLLSHDGGSTFETILTTLDELGYDTEWSVFDGSDFKAGQRPRVFIYAAHRKQENDVGERAEQAPPLYACLSERTRITDDSLQEAGRSAERIIRTFAKLPDWLDSWAALYDTQGKAGERSTAECGASNS